MKKSLGLILVLSLFLAAFGTAMAKEATIYGSARMQTLFKTESKEMAGVKDSASKDTSYFTANHSLLATSRFGVDVTDEGKKAKFELGGDGKIRQLYGEVNIGGGSILVGHAYTPASIYTFSSSIYEDNQMANYGAALSARKTQIRYAIGGFQIALIDPTQVSVNLTDSTTSKINGAGGANCTTNATTGVTTCTTAGDGGFRFGASLPTIELAYAAKFDPAYLKAYYGQNELKVTVRNGAYDDIQIKANLMGFLVGANLGMVDIALNYYTATNLYAYPQTQPNGAAAITSTTTDDTVTAALSVSKISGKKVTVEDVKTTGTALVVKAKVNEMVGVEAGYTMLKVSGKDANATNTTTTAWAQDDEAGAFYVQFPIKLAAGFTITPEYGVLDKKESSVKADKQGALTYYGFKCQLDF